MEESKKTAHQAFLNQAVAEGKLTKEQVPVFLNLMMADEANTRKAIEEMPKKGTDRRRCWRCREERPGKHELG